jgi:DNA-binding NarL/FixJ family response regulator
MRNDSFILIISRDEGMLDLYVEILRAQRLRVIGVGTYEEALTVIDLLPCRAALFDVAGRGDWAFLARLRKEIPPEVPIVVLSGSLKVDRTYRNLARDLGCAGFVAKPATGALVARALQRAAQGSPWSEYVE